MREVLRAVGVMVETSWRADAPRSVGVVVTAVGQMATLPVRAYGYKLLADAVVNLDSQMVVVASIVVAGVAALTRLSAWASFNFRIRLRENTMLLLDQRLMTLVSGVPGLEHHERPDYLDRVELLRAERGSLANPFNPISWTIGSVVQAATTMLLLAGVHPLLALMPLFGAASVATTIRAQTMYERLRERQAEPSRVLRHLLELSTEPAAAKEVRVFRLGEELNRRHRGVFDEMERDYVRTGIRGAAWWSLGWGVFALGYVAGIAFVATRVLDGSLTIGDLVLTLALGTQINWQLTELVQNVSWLVRTNRAVRRYVWLIDYARGKQAELTPSDLLPVPVGLREGIAFRDLTFRYPGTDRAVLEGVNLLVPAGSTVAIVGENGAGKTTIVKLLCRFYEPTEGAVLADGIDIRRFEVEPWRARLSAGFQDFARFQLLARESAGVGDVHTMDDDAVHAALHRAAASDLPATLPQGLGTQLGREFEGGVELSIGQWQKVALARAMMRVGAGDGRLPPLVLALDEPTASLDAPTEHALFERYTQAAREAAVVNGAITLLVSHRFSTVRMADLIIVIAGGRVAESGSHAELMARGGLYAELYGLQSRSYR